MNKKHNRAHTAAQENVKQINQDYYFPKLLKTAKVIVVNCKTCSKAKYERHPKLQTISETRIPTYSGEILHVDIYSTDKCYFFTRIDKFL